MNTLPLAAEPWAPSAGEVDAFLSAGTAPDFLSDALTFEPLEGPVRLVRSGHLIDESTLRRWLELRGEDAREPFTGQPLTPAMVERDHACLPALDALRGAAERRLRAEGNVPRAAEMADLRHRCQPYRCLRAAQCRNRLAPTAAAAAAASGPCRPPGTPADGRCRRGPWLAKPRGQLSPHGAGELHDQPSERPGDGRRRRRGGEITHLGATARPGARPGGADARRRRRRGDRVGLASLRNRRARPPASPDSSASLPP